MIYVLTRKLSDLTRLPRKLAGLAHPEGDIARRVARECVAEYAKGAATAVSEAPVHHRLPPSEYAEGGATVCPPPSERATTRHV